MKENFSKILIPLLIILSGSYFAIQYSENLHRDYYFLFHKSKANASVTSITNDRTKVCFISISYYNANTHQTEGCDVKVSFHFGNKVEEERIENTDIYYTTMSPCDIYVIGNRSPGIVIIVLRLLLTFLIGATIFFYLRQLYIAVRQILRKEN